MTVESNKTAKLKRGRPLDLSRNRVILEAVLDLLAEVGFEALTIEAVAAKAKVGKATIYRRWSAKVDLVIDAASFMSPYETINDKLDRTQDLRSQLIALLSLAFQSDQPQYQKALTAIGSAMPHNKELERGLHNDFYRRHRLTIESIVKPFLIDNHKLTGAELDLLTDIGPALITYRVFLIGKPFDRAYVIRVVDTLMMPMLRNAIKEESSEA